MNTMRTYAAIAFVVLLVVWFSISGSRVETLAPSMVEKTQVVSSPGVKNFDVGTMSSSEIDAFLIEAVTSFNRGRSDLMSNWALRNNIHIPRNGMNDFDYNRAVQNVVTEIDRAPTLWSPKDKVTVSVNTIGELVNYDFQSATYSVCLLSSIFAKGFYDEARADDSSTPTLLFIYPRPSGASCSFSRRLPESLAPKAVDRFGGMVQVGVQMVSGAAEKLLNASDNGIVNVSLQCDVFPGTADYNYAAMLNRKPGVDCHVVEGTISAGNEKIKIAP